MAESSNPGIRQLMAAEEEASKIVSEARKQRTQRLKQCKSEAEAQIKQFRDKEQQKFDAYSKEKLGVSDEQKGDFLQKTQETLGSIDNDLKSNKDAVVELLLKAVQTVDTSA
eukprot:TRINITY_DN2064_c0_g1_i2.p1 TRINITY_DN2064_c0_g1~~TRINITY_DN2064_c0_g1_i2.p1  ORF type:complete len:112 (-),score=37.41 TRINITY_DN2064_c0_g1_i2:288-623(-)